MPSPAPSVTPTIGRAHEHVDEASSSNQPLQTPRVKKSDSPTAPFAEDECNTRNDGLTRRDGVRNVVRLGTAASASYLPRT